MNDTFKLYDGWQKMVVGIWGNKITIYEIKIEKKPFKYEMIVFQRNELFFKK